MKPQAAGRFSFIDGLRGIAALLTVLPHSRGLFYFPESNAVCRRMNELAEYGGQGVQLFFVISGFVIAYSLRDATRESFSLGRFILRRSVRLDPPYWVAMLAMVVSMAIRSVMTHQPIVLPPVSQILAHVFYLQNILGIPSLNVVFWTLCLEFQLYLVFAILLVVSGRVASGARLDAVLRPAVVIACFVVSLIVRAVSPLESMGTWFVPFWYMFLGGSLLCWHMLGRVSRRQLAFCFACALVAFAYHPDRYKASALVSMLAIYVALHLGTLSTWLSGRAFQWLGQRSYSIYLLHVALSPFVLGLRTRIAPTSNVLPWVLLALLYVVVLVASHVMYVLVEAPCLALAGRLKHRIAPATEPAS